MKPRLLVITVLLAFIEALLAAQVAKPWTPPKTPDGQPDLQGVWTNPTITPFERPRELAGKEFLTEKEVKELEARAAGNRVDRPPEPGDVGAYNQFWFDSGTSVVKSRRTSLVIDPTDGRVPVKPEAEARRDYDLAHVADSYQYMSLWDRCITRGIPGGMFPAGYNNAYRIVQIPGYIIIFYEMIHNARIIPLDGKPHISSGVKLRCKTMGRRPARALGRQYVGCRYHQLQQQRLDCDERGYRTH